MPYLKAHIDAGIQASLDIVRLLLLDYTQGLAHFFQERRFEPTAATGCYLQQLFPCIQTPWVVF